VHGPEAHAGVTTVGAPALDDDMAAFLLAMGGDECRAVEGVANYHLDAVGLVCER
jgi:hypothetical protein